MKENGGKCHGRKKGKQMECKREFFDCKLENRRTDKCNKFKKISENIKRNKNVLHRDQRYLRFIFLRQGMRQSTRHGLESCDKRCSEDSDCLRSSEIKNCHLMSLVIFCKLSTIVSIV